MLLLLIYLLIFALSSEFKKHPNYTALWALPFVAQAPEFSIINTAALWQHSPHVFRSWRVYSISKCLLFFFSFNFWLETSLSKVEEQFKFPLLLYTSLCLPCLSSLLLQEGGKCGFFSWCTWNWTLIRWCPGPCAVHCWPFLHRRQLYASTHRSGFAFDLALAQIEKHHSVGPTLWNLRVT